MVKKCLGSVSAWGGGHPKCFYVALFISLVLFNVPALTIKAKEDRPLSIWARVAAGLIAVKQYVQKFVR